MSDVEIKKYIGQLLQALPCVPPISSAPLKALHEAKNYTGMVKLIKKAMNIEDVTFVVTLVPEGRAKNGNQKDAPAWVSLPIEMPRYGTTAFKALELKIFFRKDFFEKRSYVQASIAIAHELSHVVLESICHPLRKEEKAVDLTAMLLGFRLLYVAGCHTEERSGNTVTSERLGYLNPSEVNLADKTIEESHKRLNPNTAAKYREYTTYARSPSETTGAAPPYQSKMKAAPSQPAAAMSTLLANVNPLFLMSVAIALALIGFLFLDRYAANAGLMWNIMYGRIGGVAYRYVLSTAVLLFCYGGYLWAQKQSGI